MEYAHGRFPHITHAILSAGRTLQGKHCAASLCLHVHLSVRMFVRVRCPKKCARTVSNSIIKAFCTFTM